MGVRLFAITVLASTSPLMTQSGHLLPKSARLKKIGEVGPNLHAVDFGPPL